MDVAIEPIDSDAEASSELILVPMVDAVLMPGTVMPLAIGRPAIAASLQDAARTEQHVVMVLQREPFVETPSLDDIHLIGTEARLLRYFTGRDGSHNAIVQGTGRVRIETIIRGAPHPVVSLHRIAEPAGHSAEIDGRMEQVRSRSLEILDLIEQAPPELAATIRSIEAAGALADFVTGLLNLTPAEKQEILDTVALLPRLDLTITRLAYRYQVLKLSHDIGLQTRQAMEGRNREFLLREQLKAIQKELGEAGEIAPDVEDLRFKLDNSGMPEDVAAQITRELRRLERMPEGASEAGMVRTYLEWMVELPWRLPAEQPIDIAHARRVLDEDHYDLDKIKRRILEFLAVRKLNPKGHGPILCFVGPPGVGKTSLGQSIARAVGRKFVRVSLGGVHDEAEIRGHRRTYIGSRMR
jgi:ATP-dependent Lon protease